MTVDPIIYEQINVPLTPRQVMLAEIAQIAAEYGLTLAQIMGRSRRRKVVAARHHAIRHVHSKKHPHWSYPELGRFFGERDHTTIMYAVGRCRRKPRNWLQKYIHQTSDKNSVARDIS